MNVNLTVQASEIKDSLVWDKEEHFEGDGNTYFSGSKVVEEIERLVIVVEGSCVSMPEWDDVETHTYLVAITKSGRKLRLFEIEYPAASPDTNDVSSKDNLEPIGW